MRIVTPSDYHPTVRISNYTKVRPAACWPDRTIPDYQLILVVRGRFSYQTPSTGEHAVLPGEVLCIPPLAQHTFRRTDRARHAVTSCIHGEAVQGGTRAAGDYALQPKPRLITNVRGDASIHAAFRRCAAVFKEYGRYRRALMETIAREIWIRLASRWEAGGDPPVSVRMQRMIAFLRDHLCEPVSRRDLAEAFHLTPEHVNALFKRELGISPTGFVHRERVLLAYEYMRDEGLSVKEAAARVGFSDAFYFSRVFKRIMTMSPSRLLGWQARGLRQTPR
jgi:AraC-like DNA-binding protein